MTETNEAPLVENVPARVQDATEQAWRKAIVEQARRNCTPDAAAYAVGHDTLIWAVLDWIENPPDWSTFDRPDTVRASTNVVHISIDAKDFAASVTDIVREVERRFAETYTPASAPTTPTLADAVRSMCDHIDRLVDEDAEGDHNAVTAWEELNTLAHTLRDALAADPEPKAEEHGETIDAEEVTRG